MRKPRGTLSLHAVVTLLILGSVTSATNADPITLPGYTITDIGPGTPVFSADTTGNGILTASNGQSYAFPQTPDTSFTTGQATTASIPVSVTAPTSDPLTYGNPLNAYAYVQAALMNANGIVAANEAYGVSGHYGSDDAFVVQRNPDGTWGSPVYMWSENEQFAQVASASVITSINNLNQVLGSMGNGLYNDTGTDVVLYSLKTHTLTDLTQLLNTLGRTYSNFLPIALDDDGRILLSAEYFNPGVGYSPTRLLLTPDGVSSEPLPVPAPEPGTWAVAFVAIAAIATHRRRDRRRRPT